MPAGPIPMLATAATAAAAACACVAQALLPLPQAPGALLPPQPPDQPQPAPVRRLGAGAAGGAGELRAGMWGRSHAAPRSSCTAMPASPRSPHLPPQASSRSKAHLLRHWPAPGVKDGAKRALVAAAAAGAPSGELEAARLGGWAPALPCCLMRVCCRTQDAQRVCHAASHGWGRETSTAAARLPAPCCNPVPAPAPFPLRCTRPSGGPRGGAAAAPAGDARRRAGGPLLLVRPRLPHEWAAALAAAVPRCRLRWPPACCTRGGSLALPACPALCCPPSAKQSRPWPAAIAGCGTTSGRTQT